MRFIQSLLLVFLFLSTHTLKAAEEISNCNQVKIQGHCTDEVRAAKDVCKDKDKGEDIKKSFAELKGTKVDTNTNLGKLSKKYRDLEKSSKSEAQQKKACYEVATAARKDCVNSCNNSGGAGRGGPTQASCDKSLDSIDQVRKYCKKNEEAAEELAMMAADNADQYDRPPFDVGGTTSGTDPIPAAGNPQTTNPPPLEKLLGYSTKNVSPDGAGENSGDAAKAISGALGGGTSGSGSGGGGGGAATTPSADNSALGSAAGAGKASGEGLTGTGAGGSGGKGYDSGGSAVSGKSEGAPGYMFWGVPARKKKAPLTLLKPANTPAAKVQAPSTERKPAQKSTNTPSTLSNPN